MWLRFSGKPKALFLLFHQLLIMVKQGAAAGMVSSKIAQKDDQKIKYGSQNDKTWVSNKL
jgi:hypothetical protein